MGYIFRMKLNIIFCSLIIVVLASASVSAGTIIGSKHDFSTNPSNPPSLLRPFAGIFMTDPDSLGIGPIIDEVCVFCHTPHGASTDANSSSLLWNRKNPQGSLTYKMYSSTSFTASSAKPTGISLMCMSCHDGVTSIAVNTLLNAPGRGNPAVILDPLGGGSGVGAISDVYTPSTLGWGPNLGNTLPGGTTIDLSNDHPISFDYPATNATLKLPTSLRLFGAGNRVECATCHLVHDPTFEPFLAMSNASSMMCRECHIK